MARTRDGKGEVQLWGALIQVSALVHSDRGTTAGPHGDVWSHTSP